MNQCTRSQGCSGGQNRTQDLVAPPPPPGREYFLTTGISPVAPPDVTDRDPRKVRRFKSCSQILES